MKKFLSFYGSCLGRVALFGLILLLPTQALAGKNNFKLLDDVEIHGFVSTSIDAFAIDAKQSRLEGRPKAIPGQEDLFVTDTQPQGRRSANRGKSRLYPYRSVTA